MKQEAKQSVTLRDIAGELGISHATVSLALRGNARISADTRDLVKKKAEEMGYARSPMLSALSHYRRNKKTTPRRSTIAWLNGASRSLKEGAREEFRLYWKGAADTARGLGFELTELQVRGVSPEEIHAALKRMKVQGVILSSGIYSGVPEPLSPFPWSEFSVIHIGDYGAESSADHVTGCKVTNTIRAFNAVREKGYERIGYIGCGSQRPLSVAGYQSCLWTMPEQQRLPPLLLRSEGAAEAVGRWMLEHGPDAVLTDCAFLPAVLTALGYSIPGDVGIAALNIHDAPIDAGIDPMPEEIGGAAVRSLGSLLNEYHFGIPAIRSSILVKGRWVDGSMLPVR